MDIRPIRTDEDRRAALAAIDACWGAPEGTEIPPPRCDEKPIA